MPPNSAASFLLELIVACVASDSDTARLRLPFGDRHARRQQAGAGDDLGQPFERLRPQVALQAEDAIERAGRRAFVAVTAASHLKQESPERIWQRDSDTFLEAAHGVQAGWSMHHIAMCAGAEDLVLGISGTGLRKFVEDATCLVGIAVHEFNRRSIRGGKCDEFSFPDSGHR
jgi:hypothetical protein